jgi:hypothetical protein
MKMETKIKKCVEMLLSSNRDWTKAEALEEFIQRMAWKTKYYLSDGEVATEEFENELVNCVYDDIKKMVKKNYKWSVCNDITIEERNRK